MKTSDLDYNLPAELIATEPATPRDASRLMVIDRAANQISDRHVRDLPQVLQAMGWGEGDLMVFNETRVVPAYFEGVRRETGGRVTGLYVRSLPDGQWELMLESRGKLREGETITLTDDDYLELTQRHDRGLWHARLHSDTDTLALLEAIGQPPLPPYIRKERKAHGQPEFEPGDRERYNTVFAREAGSVAAPTASLHFTPALLEAIDGLGIQRVFVTLHVGLGTFMPVRAERLEDHDMHSESIRVPPETLQAIQEAKARGGRILPVGTTAVRTLESLPVDLSAIPAGEAFTADTDLYILPADPNVPGDRGFDFRYTDGLMTNFHLPCSTLLALVAALPDVGLDRLMAWYRHAVAQQYRFYSYGDAMILL